MTTAPHFACTVGTTPHAPHAFTAPERPGWTPETVTCPGWTDEGLGEGPKDVHDAETFAEAVMDLAKAAQKVEELWHRYQLPGDHVTPEKGMFPFSMALEEATAELWQWADAEAEDVAVRKGEA